MIRQALFQFYEVIVLESRKHGPILSLMFDVIIIHSSLCHKTAKFDLGSQNRRSCKSVLGKHFQAKEKILG